MKVRPLFGLSFLVLTSVGIAVHAASVATNTSSVLQQSSSTLLETLIRIVGAFFLVIAVFVAGVWIFKKSRFFSLYQSSPAQLKVLESRSLGYRNSLLVVGYYHHRFLVSVSATGVSLLSSLPDAPAEGSASLDHSPFSEQLNALQGRKA